MGIHERATEFAGLPIVDWSPDRPITDPDGSAQRLELGDPPVSSGCLPGGRLLEKLLRLPPPPPAAYFDQFLADPAADRVRAIVVSRWEADEFFGSPADRAVEQFVAARGRLRSLRALFLLDVTIEENEISWILQGDLSPLLAAYSELEHLRIRGSNGLSFGTLRMPRLRSLVVEDGGLPGEVVREVAAADLPAIEHLELWFGAAHYGSDATVADVAPMLSGDRFPSLRRLGLRNCEFADDLAKALATSSLARRIEVLDLSLGTLGDDGAEALIRGGVLGHLKRLDIHHHYCTDGMVRWLKSFPIELDATTPIADEGPMADGKPKRYVAVAE